MKYIVALILLVLLTRYTERPIHHDPQAMARGIKLGPIYFEICDTYSPRDRWSLWGIDNVIHFNGGKPPWMEGPQHSWDWWVSPLLMLGGPLVFIVLLKSSLKGE